MKKSKGTLTDSLRRMLDAFAYADLPEMLPAAGKQSALRRAGGSAPATRTAPVVDTPAAPGPRKHVALVVDGRVRLGALRYALSACARLNADLEILASITRDTIAEAIKRETDVPVPRWSIVRMSGDMLRDVADYAHRRPHTLFVVTSAADALAEQLVMDRPSDWTAHVPWLMVSDDLRVA